MTTSEKSRELSKDELTSVAGGAPKVIDFGGGYRWVLGNTGVWICGPKQCVEYPFG